MTGSAFNSKIFTKHNKRMMNMIKKIILLAMLIFNIALTQNPAFAQEQYTKNFYISTIQQKVELNWGRPENAEGKSAVISFVINTDGSVSDVNILRSSGSEVFDKSAFEAIYKATPFAHAYNFNSPVTVEFFFSPIFTVANAIHEKSSSDVVNVSNQSAYIDFSDYTNNLQDKINTNWKPKTLAKEKNAIASMNIGKDGSLGNFYIVKSSRNKKFDRDVLDAIASSVPLDVFPSDIEASNTDVQLVFDYKRSKSPKDGKPVYSHDVSASVMNVRGYDKYTKQAEQILADSLKNKRFFFHKDMIVEIKINNVGKMKYVKILKSSKDKNFDRKILALLQKTSFPPVPETIPFNDVTLKYEIVTQRGRTFRDFIVDYLFYNGTTGLKSFNLDT